jgi:hypothetical protein
LTPLQEAICKDEPGKKNWIDNLSLLDSTIGVHYVRDLRAAGIGTPQCKELLESHEAYEKELQGCAIPLPPVSDTISPRVFWQ